MKLLPAAIFLLLPALPGETPANPPARGTPPASVETIGGLWLRLAARPVASPPPPTAPATVATGDLKDFDRQPPAVQALLRAGLELAGRGLTYKYGSADPAQGGMDCSGTIYWLLRQSGLENVPRASDQQYRWVWESGAFRAVNATTRQSFEFSQLHPGDLLFWTGTYTPGVKRDPNITHVMIYAGVNRRTGGEVLIGASEGRAYEGRRINGVSVFDLQMPPPAGPARLIGYGPPPGLLAPAAPGAGNFPLGATPPVK